MHPGRPILKKETNTADMMIQAQQLQAKSRSTGVRMGKARLMVRAKVKAMGKKGITESTQRVMDKGMRKVNSMKMVMENLMVAGMTSE
jgi:hypothetical protein